MKAKFMTNKQSVEEKAEELADAYMSGLGYGFGDASSVAQWYFDEESREEFRQERIEYYKSQLKKAGMEEQVLEKANKINDRLKTINEELDRLESGSLRCDLSYGEGSKWVAIQGIDKDGLKDLLYKALSTKKKKLEEEFMNL